MIITLSVLRKSPETFVGFFLMILSIRRVMESPKVEQNQKMPQTSPSKILNFGISA